MCWKMVASTKTLILALVVLAAAASAVVEAQDRICGLTRAELVGCQPYMAAGAAAPPPPPPPKNGPCCAALQHADFACFCGLRYDRRLALYRIDANRAMQLPHACDSTKPQNC